MSVYNAFAKNLNFLIILSTPKGTIRSIIQGFVISERKTFQIFIKDF